ncbi:ceramide kinase-like [Haliotis rubra]|uniref:ceramide kinase-like n=1 Tax=Haliotis rubra TaxID=36100 RepID=UPI001EE4EEDA|nr:ceramide kinase-like [Haliotis rubra]
MLHCELQKDGLQHQVVLTDTDFIYRVKPRDDKEIDHGFTNIWNMGSIPLDRMLAVSKRVKQLKENQDSFTIHYVTKTGSCNLSARKVKFKGDEKTCLVIRDKLRSYVNKRHPIRRFLVLINPVSGKRNARTIFRRNVEPILTLCGVLTEVIVTERPKHAEEILKNRDLSDFEGVIAVGGDGFYSECVTGLLVRAQLRARIDPNDPESTITPASLPVGIIPAGSGDFIVQYLHGTRDPTTAAIHVVLGKCQKANVVSVFKGRQLCCYSGLLLGFGLIGDIMNDLEGYRWMGSARFKIIPTRSVMNRRMIDIEMDYLTDTWQTLSRSVYGIDAYVITWRPEESKMAACFGDSALSLYITGKCKLSNHMKQLRKVQLQSKDCWDYDFVDQLRVQGFRVRFPNTPQLQTPEGEALLTDKYYLNCDGEVVTIDRPEFEVRLHRDVVSLFGDSSVRDMNNNVFVWYRSTETTAL